LLIKISKNH